MKIKNKRYINSYQKEYRCDYTCEYCGHIERNGYGIESGTFYKQKLPFMKCPKCGESTYQGLFYEDTLEIKYLEELNKIRIKINEILEDTWHKNRDTQILEEINEKIRFILKMNLKGQPEDGI